jgi:hypothetical protein
VDLANDVHAADDPAESREALTVGIPFATEVEIRLITHADRKM